MDLAVLVKSIVQPLSPYEVSPTLNRLVWFLVNVQSDVSRTAHTQFEQYAASIDTMLTTAFAMVRMNTCIHHCSPHTPFSLVQDASIVTSTRGVPHSWHSLADA